MTLNLILITLSGLSFIIYGILCIFHQHMMVEFKRYKLEKFRILTGFLELLGGLGTFLGLSYGPLYFISTGGLAFLMLLGVITRIRVKDPILEILPAFVFMLINTYLFWQGTI